MHTQTCPKCSGWGTVKYATNNTTDETETVTCPICHGSGLVNVPDIDVEQVIKKVMPEEQELRK